MLQEDQQVGGPALQLLDAVEMRALVVRNLETERDTERWKRSYRQKV